MAKKFGKDSPKFNYTEAVRSLRDKGPGRLYLLYGPEDYLREQYVSKLKELCIPEGEDSFSYKRFDGAAIEPAELEAAVNAMPFLSERSFIEIRDCDINRQKDSERLINVLGDIPDYCTVVFIQNADYKPDGKVKLVKELKSLGECIEFTEQSQGALINWITRRFNAAGKGVELEAAQRLIFVSGDVMSALIPEIDKVSSYAKGDKVTVADVNAVAHHIPEAQVFDMTEEMSRKRFNNALSILSELIADKSNDVITMLSALGYTMRMLYAAKLCANDNLGTKELMDTTGMKSDYQARLYLNAARGFSMKTLKRALEICVEHDYMLKSSGGNKYDIFKQAILLIIAEEVNAID